MTLTAAKWATGAIFQTRFDAEEVTLEKQRFSISCQMLNHQGI